MEDPSFMMKEKGNTTAPDKLLLDPFEAELQRIFGRETPIQNENKNENVTYASEKDNGQKEAFGVNLEAGCSVEVRMEDPSFTMKEKRNTITPDTPLILDPFEAELQRIFGRETPVQNENENENVTYASEKDNGLKDAFGVKLEADNQDEDERVLSNLAVPNENERNEKETTKYEMIKGLESEDKFEHLRMLIQKKINEGCKGREIEANKNPEEDEKDINTVRSTISVSTSSSEKQFADDIEGIKRTCTEDRRTKETNEVTRELQNYECHEVKYLDHSPSLISFTSKDMNENTTDTFGKILTPAPTSSDSRSITPPPAEIMFEQNLDRQQEESEAISTPPPADIMFEQNPDQKEEESEESSGMYKRGQNPYERLYMQGINNQRRKDIERIRVLQERQKEMKLNLATRSYSRSREYEKTRLNNVINNTSKEARSVVSNTQAIRKESVYNRLDNRSKKNEFQSIPASRRKQVAADSTHVSIFTAKSNQTISNRQPSYYLARQERVRAEKRAIEKKELEERKLNELAKRDHSFLEKSGAPAHERLYILAKQKRLSESRERSRKKEMLRLEALTPKTLQLATRRSSTPHRKYNDGSSVHTRLYEIAQTKKRELEEKKSKQSNDTELKHTSGSRSRAVDRLYGRSAKMQEKGKKLREEIASRKKKRDPTPTRKISIHRATDIYRRGIMTKVQLELKREDEGPDTSYVSPLLNPLVLEDEDDKSYSSRKKSDLSKLNRGRSRTPARNGQTNRHSQDSSSVSGNLQSKVSLISEKLSSGSTNYAVRSRSMTPSRVRSSSHVSITRSGSRVRSRSRIRPLHRSPSPSISRKNLVNKSSTGESSGRKDRSRPQMLPRSRTVSDRDASLGRRCNSARSPQVSSRTNSIKALLRRMESDVTFYNTLKKALSDKEILDKELQFKNGPESFDSVSSTILNSKSYSRDTIETENESDVSFASSTNSGGTVFLVNSN